jgi:hypothetical protein
MNSYRLSQYDPGTGQESTLGLQTDRELPVGLHHFGDFDFRAFIRPVANNTYRFITDLEINTADLSAVILPRIVSGLSGVSWEHAVGPADGSPAYLERKFPLNQPSLKVLEGFAAEFPDFFKTITKYLEIDSIISSLSPNPDGPHITDFRVRINRNTIAKKYPEIGAVFEKLKGMVYFTGRFFDNQDRLMGFVELDSADDLFVLQFRTLNGRFLPLVGSQPPDNSTGISLTDQASLQLYAEFDIHLNIVGLHLDVASLEVPIAYSFSDRVVDLKACLLQPPDAVAAEGRAFGFLPLWLIDILIPSNVEKITSDFFQVLAMGNDGQGGRIEFMGLPQAPSRNSLVITADGETLANGTIKLGFNLQRRLAKDQQELIAEIRAFKSELLRAFYLDYQKIKKKRGCQ